MKLVSVWQIQAVLRFEIGKLFISIDTRGRRLLPLLGRQVWATAGDSALFRRVDRSRVFAADVAESVRLEIDGDFQFGAFAWLVFERVQLPVVNLPQPRILELGTLVGKIQQRPRFRERAADETFLERRVIAKKELGQARARTRLELT